MNDKLRELLVRHEGKRKLPYTDSVGKLTIGIGRNLTDNGLSDDEINYLFMNDVDTAMLALMKIFPDFSGWGETRQNALIDMMFNVGATRFLGFKKMIAAIKELNWAGAAREMRDSVWYHQVHARAEELASMVERG
jgi:lysozyme